MNQRTFVETLRATFTKKMLVVLLLGISSGLPLALVGGTLQAWMTDASVDLKLIGLFSFVGLPYTLKFLWAPFMDRFVPPFLGRRRGWIFCTQAFLVGSLIALSLTNPAENPWMVAFWALLVAFFSASQDIVMDAYRRELLSDDELGMGSGLFVNGYLFAFRFVSGAFALFLADYWQSSMGVDQAWRLVYTSMAGIIGVCMLVTLWSPQVPEISVPKSIREAVVEPLVDYFKRNGAWWMLGFILLYKVGDNMAAAMTTPFILKLGFSKTEYALVAKTFGLAATMLGGLLGGLTMLKIGLNRSLWVFGILQALSTLGFAALANAGNQTDVLTLVVAFENITAGMGTAAFTAFLASITNRKFTATQFALLSSLMGVPRTILAAPTGFLAEAFGWNGFFLFCTIIAVPGLLLLARFAPWNGTSDHKI